MDTRLQNFLAQRGLASRRAAALMVRQGRVTVNGTVATEPGVRVDSETDRVCVDGRPVAMQPACHKTIMLYKPRGYVCTLNRDQGRSVRDLVPASAGRLVPVGRLDKASEGLLLLSNDGNLVFNLTHPSRGHVKHYHVLVQGPVPAAALASLRRPIDIEGKATRPARVEYLGLADGEGHVLHFILGEGRNQQIRRLCERAGLTVLRLVRTAINSLQLPDGWQPGRWRELTGDETDALKKM